MSTYEPGTVANLSIQGEKVRGIVRDDEWLIVGHSYFKSIAVGNDALIQDIRPLVVLDLDYIRFERYGMPQILHLMRTDHRLAPMADQIEAQTNPPRIPEPGLWGVVTDNGDDTWVCTEPGRWTRIVDGVEWPWVDIADPVLIRDGI
jgi:hypothetical protein